MVLDQLPTLRSLPLLLLCSSTIVSENWEDNAAAASVSRSLQPAIAIQYEQYNTCQWCILYVCTYSSSGEPKLELNGMDVI